jgi:triacylglycerol lipase
MRRGALALAVLAAVLLAGPASGASAREPILFVHGWSGAAWNWDVMIDRFRADGYPSAELRAFSYNTAQSNASTAQEVAAEVEGLRYRTGAERVDVVAHSMGSLSSRFHLRNLGGTARVDEWVSIGGPNHGTYTAAACSLVVSCRQMLPGSSFLDALNSGDETPGAVRYGTFWSPCDEIINPDTSVILSGAANTRTGCIGHISMLASPSVYAGVRDFVR